MSNIIDHRSSIALDSLLIWFWICGHIGLGLGNYSRGTRGNIHRLNLGLWHKNHAHCLVELSPVYCIIYFCDLNIAFLQLLSKWIFYYDEIYFLIFHLNTMVTTLFVLQFSFPHIKLFMIELQPYNIQQLSQVHISQHNDRIFYMRKIKTSCNSISFITSRSEG